MSKLEALTVLIGQRLTAAAEEIFGAVERTIAEYEEEVSSSKRQQDRYRKLVDTVLLPQIKLKRIDSQLFTVAESKEEVPPEQEKSPSLDQEDPEPPQMEEKVPPEQQHCEQERSHSLDQEDPEPPQMKEEVPHKQQHREQADPKPPQMKEEVPHKQQHREQANPKPLQMKEEVPHKQQHREQANPKPLQMKEEVPHKQQHREQANPKPPQMKEEVPHKQQHREQANPKPLQMKEEVPHTQQHREQAKPKPLQMKEEQDERWICYGVELLEEAKVLKVTLNGTVKGDLSQYQTRTNGRSGSFTRTPADQKTTEPNPEGGSAPEQAPERDQSHGQWVCGDGVGFGGGLSQDPAGCGGGVGFGGGLSQDPAGGGGGGWSGGRGGLSHVPRQEIDRLSNWKERRSGSVAQPALRSHHLNTHNKAFRSPTQRHSKALSGPHCGLASCSSPTVHRHKRLFHCPVCEKKYTQMGHLKTHFMIHTGEKPYQCHMCSRAFSIRSQLARHIRSHTGEKPFACSVCHKLFARKENVQKHRRKIHGEVVMTTVV